KCVWIRDTNRCQCSVQLNRPNTMPPHVPAREEADIGPADERKYGERLVYDDLPSPSQRPDKEAPRLAITSRFLRIFSSSESTLYFAAPPCMTFRKIGAFSFS